MVSTVTHQEISKEFQKTEIGIIPTDWEVRRLGDLVKIASGESPSKYVFKDVGIPYFKVEQLNNHFKYAEETEYYFEAGNTVPANSVVFPKRGASILLNKIRIFRNASFMDTNLMSLTTFDELDSEYLFYFLLYEGLDSVADTTSIPQINNKHIIPFVIPLPKFNEQTAIANALSDVDALITSLEKLIVKKRAIKTAAMQQLLTGKKRLPPFDQTHTGYKQTELGEIPEDWEAGSFGDYLEFCSSGATPYRGRPEFYKGNVRWVSSGELNYNVIYDTIEKVSKDAVKKTNLKIHPAGTFLIAITGLEAAGTRGSCGVIGAPSTTNQSCMALYPNRKLSSNFLFHYYIYKGNELAFKYCQGTKQQSYTAKLVKLLPINVPTSIEEQEAIASVLSDMDKDTKAIKNRLTKTKQLKQGMMQELLTGRTRLI